MSLDEVSAYLKVQHKRRGFSIPPSAWMVPYSEQVSRAAASRERLRRNPKRERVIEQPVEIVETAPVVLPAHPARDRFKELLRQFPRHVVVAPRKPIAYMIVADEVTTWKRIILETCNKHNISYNEIISNRRATNIVWARQEAMWRMKTETSMSYPAIGKRFGGKDHTTVLHSVRKHEERLAKADD